MPTLPDLEEFFDPDLHLTVRGKPFTITAPSARVGLRIKANLASGESTPETEAENIALILGATVSDTGELVGGLWDELADAGVDLDTLRHVANTALAYYGVSPEFGELWWKTRHPGKATARPDSRATENPGPSK